MSQSRRGSWQRAAKLFPCVSALLSVSLAEDVSAETLLRREPVPDASPRLAAEPALEGALELFRRARADAFVSQFQNERNERLVFPAQLERYLSEGRYDDLFVAGDELFEFLPDFAFGARESPAPVHEGLRGGADGASCRACHFVGGADGAGSATQRALFDGDGSRTSSAIARDAPHLMGLGYLSLLAREMEAELWLALDEAERLASATSVAVEVPLRAKGVSFGQLRALPGGEVDRSGIEGIDPDLVVRPFGRKGRHADLVAVVDEALYLHHGVQTSSLLTRYADVPEIAGREGALDPDEDGAEPRGEWYEGTRGAEVMHAQSLLLAAYLALIGVPQVRPPASPELLVSWSSGRARLREVGCTECHVERQWLQDDTLVLEAPGFGSPLALPLLTAGQEPRPRRTDYGRDTELLGLAPLFLYSDLKRHDLGPELADPRDERTPEGALLPAAEWLTRPLWGLAETGPYLTDGRATTLHEAILWHGGEAAPSRDAYLALSPAQQADLRVFLGSLSRMPTVLVE